MPATTNPYAPPAAWVEDVTRADSAAEALRREHSQQEGAIRLVGNLYVLGGILGTLLGILYLAIDFSGVLKSFLRHQSFFGAGMVYTLLSVPAAAIGWWLRKLNPWTRIALIIFTSIGVFYVPAGTLMNCYALYLLFSPKGQRILEPRYAAVVAETSHLEPRTQAATWLIVGLLLLAMLVWSMGRSLLMMIDAAARTG